MQHVSTRQPAPAFLAIVDETCRPIAASASPPEFLMGLWDHGGPSGDVLRTVAPLMGNGGLAVLSPGVSVRVTPLLGGRRVFALLFEEFRVRAEDRMN